MLPRTRRLQTADFKSMRGSRALHSPHFLVRVQMGLVKRRLKAAALISKKIARTAPERNFLRRRIYVSLRKHLPKDGNGYVTVTGKTGIAALSFKELDHELEALLKRALSG